MEVRINRYSYPICSLGPGSRIALWVQGCKRRCNGCASVDTWNFNAGISCEVEKLADKISMIIVQEKLDGLTITGGEPIEQFASIQLLVKLIRANIFNKSRKKFMDVLMFSGYEYDDIFDRHGDIIKTADALVCGPYDQKLNRVNRLFASSNQRLVILNEIYKNKYEYYLSKDQVKIQFKVEPTGISFVGIPNSGDLITIEKKLKEKGGFGALGGKYFTSHEFIKQPS